MRRQTVAVAAGTALVLLLVLAVSVSDPVWLVRGGNGSEEELPPGLRTPEKGESGSSDPVVAQQNGVGHWFTVLASLVLLVIAVALLFLVAREISVRRRRRRESDRALDAGTRFGKVTAEPIELPQELVDTAGRLDDVLASGTPRNAIVNCWVALEDACAYVGVPKHLSETSVEFTTRVLGSFTISSTSIDELAALYREARFSTHELTEEHRTAAIDALRGVQAQLRAVRSRGAVQ